MRTHAQIAHIAARNTSQRMSPVRAIIAGTLMVRTVRLRT
jgi:hypothetical protein